MSRAARCQILARLTPHGMRHGHRTWMEEARIPQSRCQQAHQPGPAGRPEGDARGSPGRRLSVPRGHWLTRFVPSMFRPSGARDQDRLPNSDTAAPGIGTNGPGQASMTACHSADLRICVGLRGLEPRTSSLSGKRSNRLSYRPSGNPLTGTNLSAADVTGSRARPGNGPRDVRPGCLGVPG
jgi:hypothetical protein